MGKRRIKQPPPRHRSWRRVALGTLALSVLGVAGFWWLSGPPETFGGTPRLVLDREVVDLGDFRFEAPASAVFTLTNAGDGSLKLTEVPPVKVLKGC
jgi:hypothetical protein